MRGRKLPRAYSRSDTGLTRDLEETIMAKRRSSFGSVAKLPSGRWRARYVEPGTDRWVNAPATYTAKIDAEMWLATVRAEMGRGTYRPTRSTLTFGDYSTRWLAGRQLKPRTSAHYRVLLDRFLLPTFGSVALSAISPEAVREWHAKLTTGATYRAHAYSLLRTIMRTAVDDRLIAASPATIRGAGRAKRNGRTEPATLDELAAIVAAMPDELRLMVLLAAWCALRFGELAELRRKDIDMRRGRLHVRRGVTWADGRAIVGPPKSDAGVRTVAIPPHLLPVVKAHLRGHAGLELIFPSPKGNHLTSTQLYDAYWPAREAAGRPDLRFHDLRHTGAVLAAATGATLAELMARLGHSTPAAAMRYQHAAKDADARIAAALSKIANGEV
jgi:integrase